MAKENKTKEKASNQAEVVQAAEAVVKENTKGEAETVAEEDDGYVVYTLPFLPGTNDGDYQTVVINGKNYQVKYGEPIRMPKGVAEVLQQMVNSTRVTNEKIKRLQQERCITTLE